VTGNRRTQGGFTLLEILAALAVTATVLLATLGLVRNLTLTFDRGARRVDQAERLALAVDRLAQDFASARYAQRATEGAAAALFAGAPDRTTFLARAGVGRHAGTEEAVALAVETTRDGARLIRRRAAWPGGQARLEDQAFDSPVVLIEGAVEIALSYGRLDPKGALVWTPQWSGQPGPPRFVRLTVRDRATGGDLLPGATFAIRAEAPAACAQAEADASCLQEAPKKPGAPAKPDGKPDAQPSGPTRT